MAGPWDADLQFAIGAARRAGDLLREAFGRVQRVDYKGKRDVVTDVDLRSEALLLELIRKSYPGDGVVAEESGRHDPSAGAGASSGRRWIVDPLDGTVNYANGIPFYCVSVGLVVDDQPRVGVVYDPAREDLLTATADGPARLNGEPIHASSKERLTDYVVSLAVIGRGGIGRERRVAKAVRIPRRMGSAALSLAYVGAGRFDAFIGNGGLSIWDVAAAGLIAERGGATVSDLLGGPWWDESKRAGTVSIVAAPAPHQVELVRLLRSAGVEVRTRRP